MGQEIHCRAQHEGQTGEGTAFLESSEIVFRGDFRFRIVFATLTDVLVARGWLTLVSPAGRTRLELGAKAVVWAEKIRNPKSVLDKWGVKWGQRVGLIGWTAADLPGPLEARGVEVVRGRSLVRCNLVLWNLGAVTELARLEKLKGALEPAGAIWCVYPKGNRDFGEEQVRRAARAAGLVDVKVAAVSATHSSLKLVIPKAAR